MLAGVNVIAWLLQWQMLSVSNKDLFWRGVMR
jgi:hypothetical protein